MNDIQTSKLLGMVGVGLGAMQLVFGRQLNRRLGLGQSPTLVRAFGAREVATGAAVLMFPDMAAPVWVRVAGDALDIAVLLGGLRSRRRKQEAVVALAAVLGVTVLDVITAASLTHRHTRALATARRTRVRPAVTPPRTAVPASP